MFFWRQYLFDTFFEDADEIILVKIRLCALTKTKKFQETIHCYILIPLSAIEEINARAKKVLRSKPTIIISSDLDKYKDIDMVHV